MGRPQPNQHCVPCDARPTKEAAPIIHRMIDSITMNPSEASRGVGIEAVGRTANMLALAKNSAMPIGDATGTLASERVKGIEPSS